MSDAEVIHFPGRPLPIVQLSGAEFSGNLDEFERVLAECDEPRVFQRQGDFVEIALVDSERIGTDRSNDGTPAIVALSPDRMRDVLSQMVECQRFDPKKKEWHACEPPMDRVRSLLARRENHLPVLRALAMAPTLDASGRIIQTPGFDCGSGIYGAFDDAWPRIPDTPSIDDAHKALEALSDVVREFPFKDPPALAVWLAAVLTGVIRHALRSAPLFGFSAPTSGTGKSLLAELVGILVSGMPPPNVSQPVTEEEAQKTFFAHLLSGRPILVIDNIERPLEGDALCSILTQPYYSARLLGTQQTRDLPTRTLILGTGNNLAARGDMRTRVLVCHLDAQIERPEERSFECSDLRGFVMSERRRLVVAALTILRAYHVAGRPRVEATPYGRFEEWSAWVRAALLWLGVADPCATRARIEQADEKGAMLAALIAAWTAVYGERGVTVREVRHDCSISLLTEAQALLRDAALAVAGEGDSVNARKLGRFLHDHDGRLVEGLRFEMVGTYQNYAQWAVRKVW